MTSPEEVDRMTHPALRIAEPYAETTDDEIRAAIAASPTTAVRVYNRDAAGVWDTDETADVVTVDEFGNLLAIDLGSDGE